MLVLSRRVNESILLGGEIEITLLSIEGDRIRLGIDAPKNVRIFRKELIDEVKDINQEALTTVPTAFNLDDQLEKIKDNK